MRFDAFSFGKIRIDGTTYDHDVVIVQGKVRKRRKKPSKKYRDEFGHTPLSIDEDIPWQCKRLVIGTGREGAMPVMEEVMRKARRRGIELFVGPTAQAIRILARRSRDTAAILHITC